MRSLPWARLRSLLLSECNLCHVGPMFKRGRAGVNERKVVANRSSHLGATAAVK